MPGLVLETGAPEVKGASVSWKFSPDNLKLHDYEMRVESRTVNVWAMAVTAVLALGLLALLFAFPSVSRRRRMTPTTAS